MEKSRYVRIIEGERSEEMIQSNTSTPWGSEVPFESQRGQWQLKSSRMKRFLGGENGGRKRVSSAIQ